MQGDGSISVARDLHPVAAAPVERLQSRKAAFPNILHLPKSRDTHATKPWDLNHNGIADEQKLVDSHAPVLSGFARLPEHAEGFLATSTGGSCDCLDLDRDGVLDLTDREGYARSSGKPLTGNIARLAMLLAAFGCSSESAGSPGRVPSPGAQPFD